MVIPRIIVSIRYILSELEEMEREEMFRLKRVKQGKVKKKEADQKPPEVECVMCAQGPPGPPPKPILAPPKSPPKSLAPVVPPTPPAPPPPPPPPAQKPSPPPQPPAALVPPPKPLPPPSAAPVMAPPRTPPPPPVTPPKALPPQTPPPRTPPKPSLITKPPPTPIKSPTLSAKSSATPQRPPDRPAEEPSFAMAQELNLEIENEFGRFEKEIKEIVKVTRLKNPDGTISEEKQVITVKTERKTPQNQEMMDRLKEKQSRPCCDGSGGSDIGGSCKHSAINSPRQTKSEVISRSSQMSEPKLRSCISAAPKISNSKDTATGSSVCSTKSSVKLPPASERSIALSEESFGSGQSEKSVCAQTCGNLQQKTVSSDAKTRDSHTNTEDVKSKTSSHSNKSKASSRSNDSANKTNSCCIKIVTKSPTKTDTCMSTENKEGQDIKEILYKGSLYDIIKAIFLPESLVGKTCETCTSGTEKNVQSETKSAPLTEGESGVKLCKIHQKEAEQNKEAEKGIVCQICASKMEEEKKKEAEKANVCQVCASKDADKKNESPDKKLCSSCTQKLEEEQKNVICQTCAKKKEEAEKANVCQSCVNKIELQKKQEKDNMCKSCASKLETQMKEQSSKANICQSCTSKLESQKKEEIDKGNLCKSCASKIDSQKKEEKEKPKLCKMHELEVQQKETNTCATCGVNIDEQKKDNVCSCADKEPNKCKHCGEDIKAEKLCQMCSKNTNVETDVTNMCKTCADKQKYIDADKENVCKQCAREFENKNTHNKCESCSRMRNAESDTTNIQRTVIIYPRKPTQSSPTCKICQAKEAKKEVKICPSCGSMTFSKTDSNTCTGQRSNEGSRSSCCSKKDASTSTYRSARFDVRPFRMTQSKESKSIGDCACQSDTRLDHRRQTRPPSSRSCYEFDYKRRY